MNKIKKIMATALLSTVAGNISAEIVTVANMFTEAVSVEFVLTQGGQNEIKSDD
jgi:hypothetical protein